MHALQVATDVACAADDHVPPLQFKHEGAPGPEYVPETHPGHTDEPAEDEVPAAQVKQDAAPEFEN